jgi:hypothetical protein
MYTEASSGSLTSSSRTKGLGNQQELARGRVGFEMVESGAARTPQQPLSCGKNQSALGVTGSSRSDHFTACRRGHAEAPVDELVGQNSLHHHYQGLPCCFTLLDRMGETFAELAAGFEIGIADRPFYSGKHKRHGMNLQVIAGPDGDLLWVPGIALSGGHPPGVATAGALGLRDGWA